MLQNSDNVVFLTFTFKNEVLKNTNKDTRLRAIKKYLNDFASEYILNIDYGDKSQREHYHAIATPTYKIFLYDYYTYGQLKGEQIGTQKRFASINKSLEDIAQRLTEHSTKDSTLNERIVYSRKKSINIDSKYKEEIEKRLLMINGKPTLKNNEEIETDLKKDDSEQCLPHPKSFYFIYDESMIYTLFKQIDKDNFVYISSKRDEIKGFKQRLIHYNRESDIYKAYTNQANNVLIIFQND